VTDRGFAPVVGKGLEAVVVVLYVAALVTTLHGGVLPEYRAAAAAEVSDRTLASTAAQIEASIPPRASSVSVRRTVDLPTTIGRSTYRIRLANDSLVLEHPDPAVGDRVRLALPDRVATTESSWQSDDRTVIRVRSQGEQLRVILA
jgi:hypothetical protein